MAGALTDNSAARPVSSASSDRGALVLLLLGSAVTLGFLVAAMVRENFLSDWRHHQREYRRMLLASGDDRQRQLGESFTEKIRQIDLPQLGTTDRCVSCHVGLDNPAMAGARQPFRTHPGDHLKHHPVEKYGCTVCHRGQGAATVFREAKASDVHWDYPLLPARLTVASCGTCHAADSELMQKHAPALALGRRLFLERGCQGCHKLDGVGGQLGPALDGVGGKIRHQLPMAHVQGEKTLANWLGQHFEKPQGIVPGSQMRPPRLTPGENQALTVYMLSLRQHEYPQAYLPGDRIAALDREINHRPVQGDVLYNRYCATCHGDGSFGRWDTFFGRFMPAVRGPGLRALANADYYRSAVTEGRPGTLMPAWGKSAGGLTDKQIDSLTDYLMHGDPDLRAADIAAAVGQAGGPPSLWPAGWLAETALRQRPPQRLRPAPSAGGGDPKRGGELFAQMCAGCHGKNQLAPSLGNPAFQKAASDEFLARTIVNGRIDTAMPAFQHDGSDGLTDDEVRDLVAHLRSLGKK
jgi:mono/diheme cytochrome c family protein